MMTKKSEIGKLGEDLAREYLVNKRFTIIERNFRRKWGELDIIGKDSGGVLVFVEVKAMRKYNNAANNSAIAELLPEENLTAAKLRKLKRTAYLYANENSKLVDNEKGWRIDLIAITLNESETDIKHYENL